jgi:hypothetical protein
VLYPVELAPQVALSDVSPACAVTLNSCLAGQQA